MVDVSIEDTADVFESADNVYATEIPTRTSFDPYPAPQPLPVRLLHDVPETYGLREDDPERTGTMAAAELHAFDEVYTMYNVTVENGTDTFAVQFDMFAPDRRRTYRYETAVDQIDTTLLPDYDQHGF